MTNAARPTWKKCTAAFQIRSLPLSRTLPTYVSLSSQQNSLTWLTHFLTERTTVPLRPAVRPEGCDVPPRLLALSDLHVAFPENRRIIENLRPDSAADWLLVAGDVGEGWPRCRPPGRMCAGIACSSAPKSRCIKHGSR